MILKFLQALRSSSMRPILTLALSRHPPSLLSSWFLRSRRLTRNPGKEETFDPSLGYHYSLLLHYYY